MAILSHWYKWTKTAVPNLLQCSDWRHVNCFRRYGLYSSEEIRSTFLKFYEKKYQHVKIPSSKVFSTTDNSLLFVNAGMNQFKSIFLGTQTQNDKFDGIYRAVNSQRCIRVGGKHNDLEAVGKDFHHHTLFEMLGSWSFGDYFKKEACAMAWELLTEVFNLPVEKLYVTYFGGCEQLGLIADHETKKIWQSIGVPNDRILPFGSKENFWEIGEAGPCGPCTEIHYDRIDGRYAPEEVNLDGSDVIEVWNLVFMQYNRLGHNILEPLQQFHVDTGMGLERITAIMQGKVSNYDTDLFQPIISTLEKLSPCRPYHGKLDREDDDGVDAAYRIISDHIRMLTVAIGDGLFPGTKGRELIVRRVLRRAVNAGSEKLKLERMFLQYLVPVVADKLKSTYPELETQQSQIINTLNNAEEIYYNLIDAGDATFNKTISTMSLHETKFPSVGIHLLSYQGYPRDRLMKKLEKHNKIIDHDELENFFKGTNSDAHENGDLSLAAKHKKMNYPLIIQGLFSLKLSKTESCSSKYIERLENGNYKFHPIAAQIAAFVLENGDVVQDVQNVTGDVYVVFNKSCFFHPREQKLIDVGNILVEGNSHAVQEVLNVQGWLLHRMCLQPLDVHFAKVGDTVDICPTSDQWLPMLRAFCAAALVEDLLPSTLGEKVVQKVKCEHDFLKYEISGILSSDEVIAFEHAVRASIPKHNASQLLHSHNAIYNFQQQDLCEFITIKHKRQGTGRTIVQFVTGPRAVCSTKTLIQLEQKVENVLKEHAELSSPTLTKVANMIERVGALTYDVNKSEISFLSKMNLKSSLRVLSGRLHTLQRNTTKQSKAASSKIISS